MPLLKLPFRRYYSHLEGPQTTLMEESNKVLFTFRRGIFKLEGRGSGRGPGIALAPTSPLRPPIGSYSKQNY